MEDHRDEDHHDGRDERASDEAAGKVATKGVCRNRRRGDHGGEQARHHGQKLNFMGLH